MILVKDPDSIANRRCIWLEQLPHPFIRCCHGDPTSNSFASWMMSISRRIRGERVWIITGQLCCLSISRHLLVNSYFCSSGWYGSHTPLTHTLPRVFWKISNLNSSGAFIFTSTNSPKVPVVRWIFSWSGRNSRSIHAGNPCKDWQLSIDLWDVENGFHLDFLYYHISSSQLVVHSLYSSSYLFQMFFILYYGLKFNLTDVHASMMFYFLGSKFSTHF